MHVKYTAISRKKVSNPVKYLLKKKLITLEHDVLDYGCGRGYDALVLGFDRYDKYWQPNKPDKKYDVIVCSFVLNVVDIFEQRKIIKDIRGLLKPNGTCFITVRRDLKEDIKYDTYTQRLVYLNLHSVYSNSHLEMYMLKK